MNNTPPKMHRSVKEIVFSQGTFLIAALMCTVGYTLALIAVKVTVGKYIDSLSGCDQDNQVVLKMSFLAASTLLFGYLHWMLSNSLVAKLQTIIYCNLIQHISIQAELCWQDEGKITTLMAQDVNSITKCTLRFLQRMVPDTVLFFTAVYTLGKNVRWIVALAIIMLCTIQVFLSWNINDRIKSKRHDFQNELEEINQLAFLGIDNLEAVKAYCCEDAMFQNYCKGFQKYNWLNLIINRVTSTLSAGSLAFTFSVMLFITIVCGKMAAQGSITMGTFFVALTMMDSIISPVMRFDNSIKVMLGAKTNVERIDSFLSTPEQSIPKQLCVTEYKIEFQRVCFSYEAGKKLLQDVSFSCIPGTCNFILGKNGCGKSTITKLLLGMHRPQHGKIIVLGNSVDTFSTLALSQSVAVLAQDNVILPTTIWENITLGALRISKAQVYMLCEKIGIHSEIEALPQKYATKLQDNGEPLSVGQRKRISIVRTLLRDVPVYVFDEPSAGLDSHHVLMLKKVLRELSKHRVVIIITHDTTLMENDGMYINIEGR